MIIASNAVVVNIRLIYAKSRKVEKMMSKHINKKAFAKVTIITLMFVLGTASVSYAKGLNKDFIKNEAETPEVSVSKERKIKYESVKKSINESAEEAIKFSDEKMDSIKKSVENSFYDNKEENAEEAQSKGMTEEQLLQEKVDSRICHLPD